MSPKTNKPINMVLYNKVKKEAKNKFRVWPSAYASGWLVKEYKRRGGKYSEKKPGKSHGLERWFNEKWINICRSPPTVCGRPKTNLNNWKKKYPYCRPSIRISKSTTKIASELSKKEIYRRCKTKQKSPLKRVSPRKAPRRSLKKTARKTPRKAPRKTPRKTHRKTPRKAPRRSLKKTPRKAPRRSLKKTPRKAPRKAPRRSHRRI